MKNINLIYLRSKISTDPREFNAQKKKYEDALKKKYVLDASGENIFFIESGGVEEQFRQIYESYKEPYILIATDANNSLPASLEIASFLKHKNLKYKLFHAKAEDIAEVLGNSVEEINAKNEVLNTDKKILNGVRYGVVGKPSDWLISSGVDYKDAKERFGVELVDVTFEEFKKEIDTAKLIIDPVVYKDKLNEKISKETLEVAIKIFSALYSIIKKHNLNGLTVRCFDLLGVYHNTSCLALALLNEMGYVATCEGDIPAMITMGVIRKAFNKSSFQVNPSYINLKERYGYFAHCTIPLDMCISYDFDTHFESGLGIGIKGHLNLSKVTVFKIDPTLQKYEVFAGQIVANLNHSNLCRTQLKIQFSEDISSLTNLPCGNHLIIVKGDHKDEIIKLLTK